MRVYKGGEAVKPIENNTDLNELRPGVYVMNSQERPQLPEGLSQEQMEKIAEVAAHAVRAFMQAMSPIFDTVKEAAGEVARHISQVADALGPALEMYAATFRELQLQNIEGCPNRRVVHLARHGKKARTRKKNVRRAFKILQKEAKP